MLTILAGCATTKKIEETDPVALLNQGITETEKIDAAVIKPIKAFREINSPLKNKILKRGEIRVGFESGYVPFEMTSKNRKFIGFDIDLANELAKAMGVRFVPVNTSWDGIISKLIKGKFDIIISGMNITEARSRWVDFSDPYVAVGQRVLLNRRHKNKIQSYKDLNRPKFIVTSRIKTTGEQAVKKYIPKATYKGFDSEAKAALEVVNGKADAMVYDLPFITYVFSQHKNKTSFLDTPITEEPLSIAINKGDPEMLNWINDFLRQIKSDGRYDKMYNYWIMGSSWKDDLR